MQPSENVTQLLVRFSNGEREALDSLMPLVYNELHRLADSYLRRERNYHTLQPTALVHEAYLRLVDQRRANWKNRAHFLGVAAQLMRRILVDHARRRQAEKRGGAQERLSLTHVDLPAKKPDVKLLALDDALNDLAAIDDQQSRIIELRFFGGLTIEETAEVLGISHSTVERDWRLARAWLRREIEKTENRPD